ncbi:hypothetical protein GIB67_000210 [Kingdonia uniflora]|uniref:AAA+ ATPase domain-containing protein n=1 Tax=Kingdonia uniflora TaxID=39325 RepID=A0A7J7P9N0_9MAGN|nr:hypothetical protein GIB67_000210 [Kingdonia uniflora]
MTSPSLLFPHHHHHLLHPLAITTSNPTFSNHHRLRRSTYHHCNLTITNNPSSSSPSLVDIELGFLLGILPGEMQVRLRGHSEIHQLIEVVMDLGRTPLARFPSGDFVLSQNPITVTDLQFATSQVGEFAIDNRAGISRTLHRISAIKNRKGAIIGLTCRVGRAITGSANLLRDLVSDGSSLLLIGPPGVGKTTIIREIARMLADDYGKRVMIVDTSNEIGGDGDIPHAGIGNSRRMQVPNSDIQHKVLIEAVENHMPQVIVIDEIGTKLEAMTASTIAQRGIQLVATAHGITIENLIMNPSLEMLVGGIQSVTLGDEEASRRGVQKTVLERKGPSTFTCGVEIKSRAEIRVHCSLEATVDAVLSGRAPNFEVRKRSTQGMENEFVTVQSKPSISFSFQKLEEIIVEDPLEMNDKRILEDEITSGFGTDIVASLSKLEAPIRLYLYGIPETSVMHGIKQLKVEDKIKFTDNISEADALLALQSKLKKNLRIQGVAKSHDIPVYMTKTSSLAQITKAIRALLSNHSDEMEDFEEDEDTSPSEKMDALEEARLAIEQIVIPKGQPADLLPRSLQVISLQMDLINKYNLQCEKVRNKSKVSLCILPLQSDVADNSTDDTNNTNGIEDSVYSVDRLPVLPD